MKRFLLLFLIVLSCGTIITPQLKLKHSPPALTAAQNYTHTKADLPTEMNVETFFGPIHITEPLLIELLHHPVLTRTRDIDQHGPPTYFAQQPTFSRYEHSLGVFALLRMHKRPLVEQVAGLLHDVSHTVFSHVADHLFKTGNQINYQDTIHHWYLEKMGLASLLARYHLSIEDIDPDQPEFCALEQKSPKLCADRIQYILHTGIVFNKITHGELNVLLETLHFDGSHWYFSDQKQARILADLALHFTEHFWATADNLAWRHWLCSALKQAIARNLITSDDIHFGTDSAVLTLLNTSHDPYIKEMMHKCYHYPQHYVRTDPSQSYDLSEHPKLRAVDPLVLLDNEVTPTPLSQRDSEYKNKLEETRHIISHGTYVQWIES
jgi:hypothetical protein